MNRLSEPNPLYLSPFSVLVHGELSLRRLHCPFYVEPKKIPTGKITGKSARVDQVSSLPDGRLVFHIEGVRYLYSLFWILFD